jgi:hypothetical protein
MLIPIRTLVSNPAVRGWIWITLIALWLAGLAIDGNWHALCGVVGVAGAVYVWYRWGLWLVLGALVAVAVALWGSLLVGLLAAPKVLLAVLALGWIGNRFKAVTGRSLW